MITWSTPEKQEFARQTITTTFLHRFDQWLKDEQDMPDREYAKKYGIYKSTEKHRDNLKAVGYFQKNIWSGHWLQTWESQGLEKDALYDLLNEGFISRTLYSNYMARTSGREEFFYLNQKKAKQIWKEHR